MIKILKSAAIALISAACIGSFCVSVTSYAESDDVPSFTIDPSESILIDGANSLCKRHCCKRIQNSDVLRRALFGCL